MRGYNLPDNVSPSDPEAPWNKEEQEDEEESDFEETNDEGLLSLLLEAESSLNRDYPATVRSWTYSKGEYKCIKCHRIYLGQVFHPGPNNYIRRCVESCPRCLDEKLWWRHQNFVVEQVMEIEPAESVQNTNRLEED